MFSNMINLLLLLQLHLVVFVAAAVVTFAFLMQLAAFSVFVVAATGAVVVDIVQDGVAVAGDSVLVVAAAFDDDILYFNASIAFYRYERKSCSSCSCCSCSCCDVFQISSTRILHLQGAQLDFQN